MLRQFIVCACLLLASSIQLNAQNTKSFQKKMKFWMGWYHIPGAQIVILKEGKVANSFNFGKTVYRGDVEINNNTKFQVGKVNQIFSSFALMREISSGNIKKHVELNAQLTGYKLRNSVINKHKKTTPIQLLNHSGGINRPSFNPLEQDLTIPIIDLLKGSKITGKKKIHNFQTPLKSYLYSEGAFVLARYLVEEKSGLKYQDYLNTYITKHLNIDCEFNGYKLGRNQLASAHDYSKWAFDTPYKFPNPSGYGCWISAKAYGELVLQIFENKDLPNLLGIHPKLYTSFQTPAIKIKESSYSSCAVFEKHDYEKGVFKLTDTRHGYRSMMYYDTESKEGFILLINSEHDYMFRKHNDKVFKKFKKLAKKYHVLDKLLSIDNL